MCSGQLADPRMNSLLIDLYRFSHAKFQLSRNEIHEIGENYSHVSGGCGGGRSTRLKHASTRQHASGRCTHRRIFVRENNGWMVKVGAESRRNERDLHVINKLRH